jgi:epoxyqueuosine reductase
LTSDELKQRAEAEGFGPVGVCAAGDAWSIDRLQEWLDAGRHAGMDWMPRSIALRRTTESLLPGGRSVLAVGLNYAQPADRTPGQPWIAQYALGRDYHKVVRQRLRRVAEGLEGAWRVCVDSAPMLEREWAHRAGLGWYGKNTMLINSRQGSLFVLGFLLMEAELEPDQPSQGGCGSCRACIDACPTGAIVWANDRWQVDARTCISGLTIEHKGEIAPELAAKMGGWTFGCDVCQDVCPFNSRRESQPERAQPTQVADFSARPLPSLEELAEISYKDWDRLTAGSPLRRAGWEGLRRNAQINLQNLASKRGQ